MRLHTPNGTCGPLGNTAGQYSTLSLKSHRQGASLYYCAPCAVQYLFSSTYCFSLSPLLPSPSAAHRIALPFTSSFFSNLVRNPGVKLKAKQWAMRARDQWLNRFTLCANQTVPTHAKKKSNQTSTSQTIVIPKKTPKNVSNFSFFFRSLVKSSINQLQVAVNLSFKPSLRLRSVGFLDDERIFLQPLISCSSA